MLQLLSPRFCLPLLLILASAVAVRGDLIHRYPFDLDASDIVGTNHGVMMNGATIVADSIRGNVLLLDGVDDFVSLSESSLPSAPTDTSVFTIAVWSKIEQLPSSGVDTTFYSETTVRDVGVRNGFGPSTATGRLKFTQYTPVGGDIESIMRVDSGDWTHVSIVQEEVGETPRQLLYINGVLDAQSMEAELYDGTEVSQYSIGARRGVNINLPAYLGGRLDDLRFYDHALNASEIAELATFVPEPSAFSISLVSVGFIAFLRSKAVPPVCLEADKKQRNRDQFCGVV